MERVEDFELQVMCFKFCFGYLISCVVYKFI